MRNVYMSFLGRGGYDKERKCYDYRPTRYMLDGRESSETRFVQVAEMELLSGKSFDLVLILCTKQSKADHFQKVQREMEHLHVFPEALLIDDDLGSRGQWDLFEKLLACIEHEDRLTVDLTHGFRSTAIVFSAAINFLQRARKIHLEAVYYGAFEMDNARPPIIDMKDFYVVNEWAEAVSRLVEDADARKLAEVADQSSGFQAGELNDKALVMALEELTNAVRNVEVNTVAERANRALAQVEQRRDGASVSGKLLLGLVVDKFASLSTQTPVSGHYDADYFQVQLAIARLLLEHRLYMQAFTVMRESIGSLALIPRKELRMTNSEGRKRRARYGDVFIQMMHWPREEWTFSPENQVRVNKLTPLYEELERLHVVGRIRGVMEDLSNFRNGFDHAWTSRVADFENIKSRGNHILAELEAVFAAISRSGLLSDHGSGTDDQQGNRV